MINFIMYSTVFIIFSTISAGVYFLKKGYKENSKIKHFLQFNLSFFIPLMMGLVILMMPEIARAANTESTNAGMGYIGAALSTGLACLGCGVAVGNVGSAALGAVSEDEKMLGKTLIFVGLAEGIAIYGLVISIMILGSL
ncbi:ATPase [Alkalibaculum sp. M08DMB]|uniref:ATPase n=1 Tax=Alkalibaculum sporogenes TaxID=2655001 RepID=A0A6A7K580_9FIRM|nr:ATP synthase subunit C [Alkalibaculum sporogenes]MPW24616.1 ATPase [Alkalibaculum sporogenes]